MGGPYGSREAILLRAASEKIDTQLRSSLNISINSYFCLLSDGVQLLAPAGAHRLNVITITRLIPRCNGLTLNISPKVYNVIVVWL